MWEEIHKDFKGKILNKMLLWTNNGFSDSIKIIFEDNSELIISIDKDRVIENQNTSDYKIGG